MSEQEFRSLLNRGFDGIAAWESRWRSFTPHPSLTVSAEAAKEALDALVQRLADNYPFFHPDYAGQMLRPPHPIALAAYAITARINPNNHALDGGPATAELERECVAQIAEMFGLRSPFLGHLTSSGTIANLEALWVAARLHPDKCIAFSEEAHYTHSRMCEVLGAKTIVLPVDRCGKMDLDALSQASPRIGTIVVTAGTTSLGTLDPIDRILRLARSNGMRVHVDAAYGGFFTAIADVAEAQLEPAVWHAIGNCDSIVVDPHKHALQPYGCGAVLFADPGVGAFYKHDSPYTYFTSTDLHLGEISLECSRAGAAAAALWTTLRCFPLDRHGLGRSLLACRHAALAAYNQALLTESMTPIASPELDIVALAPLARDERVRASIVSKRTDDIFEACEQDPQQPRYLAKWRVPRNLGAQTLPGIEWDDEHCTVVRSVLMKPEHERDAPALVARLADWPSYIV